MAIAPNSEYPDVLRFKTVLEPGETKSGSKTNLGRDEAETNHSSGISCTINVSKSGVLELITTSKT